MTEEIARLIAAARKPMWRCLICIAYGAGLRASEVVAIKVKDIDRERMVLRIIDGKGGHDRVGPRRVQPAVHLIQEQQ